MREYSLKNPFTEPAPESTVADALAPRARQALTVSELARAIQGLLEETFENGVWVEGEISDPKVYPSGHLWFDLKDANATIKSVVWRDDARRIKFQPEQGLQVVCFGKVDFYAPRGEVKFVVRTIEPKGMGALQLAFEQMKERLQKEGLFSEERKRPLPAFPERVGLVTSPRGAAIDDMLKVLRGKVAVLLCPTRVQGDGAASAVARGIRALNAIENLDLLIVGRGGGSLEDLWAFNEEAVARAIFHSKIPVISAVGHEKDVTIADLVADLRAATPTRAAEMVAAQRREFFNRLETVLDTPAFADPEEWLEELQERFEESEEALGDGLQEPIRAAANRLRVLRGELMTCSPQTILIQQAQRVRHLKETLIQDMGRRLEQMSARLRGLGGRLDALSPLAVLERGYSITLTPEGRLVRKASEVKPGDQIQTRLHRGRLISRIESSQEE